MSLRRLCRILLCNKYTKIGCAWAVLADVLLIYYKDKCLKDGLVRWMRGMGVSNGPFSRKIVGKYNMFDENKNAQRGIYES